MKITVDPIKMDIEIKRALIDWMFDKKNVLLKHLWYNSFSAYYRERNNGKVGESKILKMKEAWVNVDAFILLD